MNSELALLVQRDSNSAMLFFYLAAVAQLFLISACRIKEYPE
jgi:hypothetical protein